MKGETLTRADLAEAVHDEVMKAQVDKAHNGS